MFFSPRALAEGNNNLDVNPDSSLYSIDRLIEKAQLLIVFDTMEKANLLDEIAQERLEESRQMLEKNKVYLSGKTLEAYNEALEEVFIIIDRSLEQGDDVSKAVEIIKNHSMEKEELVNYIVQKLPDDSKEKVIDKMQNLVDKTAVIDQVYSAISNEDNKKNKKSNSDMPFEKEINTGALAKQINDERILQNAKNKGVDEEQILIIKCLSDRSGKSFDEVMKIHIANKCEFNSTIKELNINRKDALKDVKKTFKEYRKDSHKKHKASSKNKKKEDKSSKKNKGKNGHSN